MTPLGLTRHARVGSFKDVTVFTPPIIPKLNSEIVVWINGPDCQLTRTNPRDNVRPVRFGGKSQVGES